MVSQETDQDYTSASPELIAKAEALVREYAVTCFWFRHPEAKVRFLGDIRIVIQHLREYGNRRAWLAAQDLQRCL